MFNESHTYDLAFVPPSRRPRTPPELVFIIPEARLEDISERLVAFGDHLLADAEHYCQEPVDFVHLDPDLFGRSEFGVNRCAYVTREDDEVRLHFELKGGQRVFETTMTVHILFRALMPPPDTESTPSNRPQQVDIMTGCDRNRSGGWGHAVGGYISSTITTWLEEYAARHATRFDETGRPRDPAELPEVVKAMRETWYAITDGDFRRWARDCWAVAQPDGRFGLGCFGNACDIAIYPDQFSREMAQHLGSTEFGCHNLDMAEQQLTLLAGLAKLCELARERS